MDKAMKTDWRQELKDPGGCRHLRPIRQKGQTMVIDKGLGLQAFADFLDLAGPYVDMIKLGFGTAALYRKDLLIRKIELAKEHDIVIMPGGTMLEAAIQQNAAGSFLDTVCELGFNGLEISDGTIELERKRRTELVKEGVRRGLYIVTEYGKKADGFLVDAEALAYTADADFAAGAELMTVEARESGKVGLFDEQGRCKQQTLEDIRREMPDCGRLMWEAPIKDQQVLLLKEFGANVNLGNIAPTDAIALEALRRGLRSDTFEFGIKTEPVYYMI